MDLNSAQNVNICDYPNHHANLSQFGNYVPKIIPRTDAIGGIQGKVVRNKNGWNLFLNLNVKYIEIYKEIK
jgi:hypothetical protein